MKARLTFLYGISLLLVALLQTEPLASATFIWANKPNGPFPISRLVCPLPPSPNCGKATKVPGAIIYADGNGWVASYLNPIPPSNAPLLLLVEGDTSSGGTGFWELDYDLYNHTANILWPLGCCGYVLINLQDANGAPLAKLEVRFDRYKTCEVGPQKHPGGSITNDLITRAAKYTISQYPLWEQIKPC